MRLLPTTSASRRFAALLAAGCLAAPSAAQSPLVRLADVDSTILQDMRYFGRDNFIGRPVRGYGAPQCLLTPAAAAALARAQAGARERGLGLLVYDCYRPQRAVDDFVQWGYVLRDTTTKPQYYPDVQKAELFERGYISARSGHSRGSTVDLTLVRDGEPLDMGTPFDFFDERSHTASLRVPAAAMANRMRLKAVMEGAGFRNYAAEWWHYALVDEPYPDTYFDLPVE
jgi:D-alanyl-D-alanine dipeptidase